VRFSGSSALLFRAWASGSSTSGSPATGRPFLLAHARPARRAARLRAIPPPALRLEPATSLTEYAIAGLVVLPSFGCPTTVLCFPRQLGFLRRSIWSGPVPLYSGALARYGRGAAGHAGGGESGVIRGHGSLAEIFPLQSSASSPLFFTISTTGFVPRTRRACLSIGMLPGASRVVLRRPRASFHRTKRSDRPRGRRPSAARRGASPRRTPASRRCSWRSDTARSCSCSQEAFRAREVYLRISRRSGHGRSPMYLLQSPRPLLHSSSATGLGQFGRYERGRPHSLLGGAVFTSAQIALSKWWLRRLSLRTGRQWMRWRIAHVTAWRLAQCGPNGMEPAGK
jgi:hypothetical protein